MNLSLDFVTAHGLPSLLKRPGSGLSSGIPDGQHVREYQVDQFR